MTVDEPSGPSELARLLGWVWIVAGGLAIAVGVFSTVVMIVVFGALALVLGLVLQALSRQREKSRHRGARTLSGDPPPPATAPLRPPPPPPPPQEPEPEPEPEPAVEPPVESSENAAGSDAAGAGTAPRGAARSDPEVSASDVGDGASEPISEQDRPGRPTGTDHREGA